jgi:hypothetical protein
MRTLVVVTAALVFAGTAWGAPTPPDYVPSAGYTVKTYSADGKKLLSTESSTSTTAGATIAGPLDSEGAGCRGVDYWVKMDSSVLQTLLWKFHQDVYWCWSYPKITQISVGTHVSDMAFNILYHGVVSSNGYWYTWRNAAHGGHYSYRQGWFENCIFHYGCVGSWYPSIQVWVNGNGANTFQWDV